MLNDIIGQAEANRNGLAELEQRLTKLHDRLFGPVPEKTAESKASPQGPGALNHLRSTLEDSMSLEQRIFTTLYRLEEGLLSDRAEPQGALR